MHVSVRVWVVAFKGLTKMRTLTCVCVCGGGGGDSATARKSRCLIYLKKIPSPPSQCTRNKSVCLKLISLNTELPVTALCNLTKGNVFELFNL
jgi:hypothetical protein